MIDLVAGCKISLLSSPVPNLYHSVLRDISVFSVEGSCGPHRFVYLNRNFMTFYKTAILCDLYIQ